jgi:hypothetical protein
MGSAHNVHPGFDLWSNSRQKDGSVVAFIVCGLIASASGLVLQMAGRDANVDARSVIAAMPLNPGTLLSTIVTPAPPAASAPESRQGTASPSNSPQTAPLNAIPTTVTASTREATTELSRRPVAASDSTQTAPLNAIPTPVTASTASTGEATTGIAEQPAAASNKSQKAVRSPKQGNQGRYDAAAGWGRYVHERPSSGW